MSAKKKITQEQIISFYMDEVLSEETLAQSVYAFAKRHHFEESEFYNQLGVHLFSCSMAKISVVGIPKNQKTSGWLKMES